MRRTRDIEGDKVPNHQARDADCDGQAIEIAPDAD